MSIVLVGSTSGSITLQEPAVAGTTVLDLPAVSGTILTTTSPKAGNVIQVVNGTSNSGQTTTSTSYVNYSSLNLSITPTSSSSKILVIIGPLNVYNGATDANMQITLYRGATNLGGTNGYFSYIYGSSSANFSYPTTITYLDSPATTSSTTYGIYGKTSSGTMDFNNGNGLVSITLLEIAA